MIEYGARQPNGTLSVIALETPTILPLTTKRNSTAAVLTPHLNYSTQSYVPQQASFSSHNPLVVA